MAERPSEGGRKGPVPNRVALVLPLHASSSWPRPWPSSCGGPTCGPPGRAPAAAATGPTCNGADRAPQPQHGDPDRVHPPGHLGHRLPAGAGPAGAGLPGLSPRPRRAPGGRGRVPAHDHRGAGGRGAGDLRDGGGQHRDGAGLLDGGPPAEHLRPAGGARAVHLARASRPPGWRPARQPGCRPPSRPAPADRAWWRCCWWRPAARSSPWAIPCFPRASLAEGLRQDFAAGAHLFLRLRVLHPVLAVADGPLPAAS